MMQIIVNGEQRVVGENTTLSALLEQLGLRGKPCAAEVNRQVVPRGQHESKLLQEGDRIELVTLVGGG